MAFLQACVPCAIPTLRLNPLEWRKRTHRPGFPPPAAHFASFGVVLGRADKKKGGSEIIRSWLLHIVTMGNPGCSNVFFAFFEAYLGQLDTLSIAQHLTLEPFWDQKEEAN